MFEEIPIIGSAMVMAVYLIGAIFVLYQMQTHLGKCEKYLPGLSSSYWLFGLAVFSLALAQTAEILLQEFFHASKFPSVVDLFTIVGYISFLLFLFRLMFPGTAKMWLSTLAAAMILSFQALLFQYILIARQEVSMAVLLQFLYILLGFGFVAITIYIAKKYRGSPAGPMMLALGVFSLAQLGGNWFYSVAVSEVGTSLVQSADIGALLAKLASAIALAIVVPLSVSNIEGKRIGIGLLGERRIQLAAGAMILVIYLLFSSMYFTDMAIPKGGGERLVSEETALRNSMVSAQGAFQIYLIFAILFGYSQSRLKTEEFEERILLMNKKLDKAVAEKTALLNEKLEALEKFKKLTVGREIRMMELKRKLAGYEQKLGKVRGRR